jgi:RNA polymerase sigma-70 factor, ECF subfamily
METVNDQHKYDEAAIHQVAERNRAGAPPQPLLMTVARLRAFAILLCLNVDLAEQLVTVTLLRAGVVMKPSSIGPSLSTWLFSRMRQYYYREYAGGWKPSALSRYVRHGDLLAGLAELTAEQREALVLVEAAGCSRREAAHICRCTPIQLRNRFTDARDRLARALSKRSSTPDAAAPLTVAFAALAGSRVAAIG